MNDSPLDPLHETATPPPELPEALAPYWRMGVGVFAPILTPFARWVVARANGRVFAVQREGRFLARLIGETARAAARDFPIAEIQLSRRAVTGAALFPDDLSALGDLVAVAPGETVDQVLDSIGLAQTAVETVLPGFDMRRPGALAALAQTIAATDALREKVLAHAAQRRRGLMEGLSRHLAETSSVTLVMLDPTPSIQVLLARILAREGAMATLEGLYFARDEGAPASEKSSAFVADPLASRLHIRTPEVLEHVCSCREGSLSHYDDTGAPVLLADQRSALQFEQMEALQAGVLAGAAVINRNLGDLASNTDAAGADVAKLIIRLLLHPTREEAETIGGWQHVGSLDLTDRRRLADLAFDPAALEYRGLAALAAVTRHNTYWPGAAFALVNPFLGEAFAAASEGRYDPALLTAGPLLGALTLIPDVGDGFDQTRARAAPLALNAFGRGEMRLLVKPFGAEALKRVKLVWPAAQAVVAVAPPVFVWRGERDAQVLSLRGLTWQGTREIQQGLQLTTGVAAETVLDLADPPPVPHALEMTLRFKYLRLTPMFAQR